MDGCGDFVVDVDKTVGEKIFYLSVNGEIGMIDG